MLNRALVDRDTGLFADVDVVLLPEATSARAIRALGRFFGTADRDDVLLVYFSGHGKLDQSGRLHLCMQDTDSTDLLSTAVSSTRVNEFADASRARNVVIVLDCCHAGAFRGGELGDAVAGPGRYVLTSCRSAQLANDATVENGTSLFTQHLVDGLLEAAPDQDGDGYVSFSEIYAYVDRRLRAAGKQIPQRRVNGDGDLPLAKRPQRPTGDSPTATQPSASVPAEPNTAAAATPPASRWARLTPRSVPVAVVAIATLAIGLTAAALVHSRSAGTGSVAGGNSYTASAPWRLRIEDRHVGTDSGCIVTLAEVRSGESIPLPGALYGATTFQMHQTGSFRWQSNDPACRVTAFAGSGTSTLPFTMGSRGDSSAFAAPPQVVVRVKDFAGSPSCGLALYDPADGQSLDIATATPQSATVTLRTGGRRTVYLGRVTCVAEVSAD